MKKWQVGDRFVIGRYHERCAVYIVQQVTTRDGMEAVGGYFHIHDEPTSGDTGFAPALVADSFIRIHRIIKVKRPRRPVTKHSRFSSL